MHKISPIMFDVNLFVEVRFTELCYFKIKRKFF